VSDLDKLDFGLGAAQQEWHLGNYFYRSGAFKLACSDEIYLILGAKGAGKSAIFRMMSELESEIPIFASPNLCVRDDPLLRDHYATLQTLANASLATLWRFYMASLIADRCLQEADLPAELRAAYGRFLVRWGLVREVPTAWQAMKHIRVGVGFGDYFKTEFPPKAPLAVTEIDYVIYSADEWLESRQSDLWLCLDSLDEASLNGRQHDEVEDILSNLMRAVAEVLRLRRIRFKLFFRSDIYQSLTYVNKDHFGAVKLELQWSQEDLAILLGHRLRPLHPGNSVLNALEKPGEVGGLSFGTSKKWIDELFEWCPGEPPSSFKDLYGRIKDGNGVVLPRDLIKFCIEAKRAQKNFDTQGIAQPTEGRLISGRACNIALRETAKSKLTDFLQVFQNFRDTYDLLKGSASRHFTRSQLSAALGKKERLDADLVIADLVRVGAVGIKDKKSINQSDAFEIPYLYAKALEIGESNE
jgi:energy-coupling factor transporter ATP-binding protein EcfA2